MIEAVLWDFGGVLTTSPFEAFNRYEAQKGIPRDFIRRVNATNPTDNAWAKFESSQVSVEAFDALFMAETAAAGHRIPGAEVLTLLAGSVRPGMVTALRRCKEKLAVGCLTNNVKWGKGPSMTADPQRASEVKNVMALFDVVVQSSEEGMRKPEPAIYELACRRMQVLPENVIYLDDLGINLKPARALGMRTIKVVSEDQAIAELQEMVGFSLR